MRVRVLAILSIVVFTATSSPSAQESLDRDVFWKIRREATDHSQIMGTLQVLTDVYGPRLTGSPNLKGAGEWVVKEATTWGLKNARLEPWEFGHPGWLNEKRWTVSHKATSIHAACMGAGYAWFPEETVRTELAAGRLVRLPLAEGAERHATLYLVVADAELAGPGTLRLAVLLRERTRQGCEQYQA